MISAILSRIVILVFGTLYPAYASYKAVKTKNVKEYVKWMMYWIVFALFTFTETLTDIFLSWFPFYYEIKIILVIWLLSPATKGSSILYRKFVHPMLSRREQEIDEYISKAKEQSYRQMLDLGSKGVTVLMQTAIKSGGGIVNQLKKSYSLSDLSDPTSDCRDEADDVVITDPRLVRRRQQSGRSPHRSSSASSASVYFAEVDVVAGGVLANERIASVKSTEDISSGYSSGEGLYAGQPLKLHARESLHRTSSLTRSRTTRVTRSSMPKKSAIASDESDENEVFDTNITFYTNIAGPEERNESSSSENEFYDTVADNPATHGKQIGLSPQSNTSKVNGTVIACPNLDLTPVSVASSLKLRPLSEPGTDKNLIRNLENILSSITTPPALDSARRGGKYNKKPAPPPPPPRKPNAIKATLVLKPGVIKTISNEDIFLNSPKDKRRSRSRSPAPSPNSRTSKMEALSRVLRLPKKIAHLSVPKKLVESRAHSKSAGNIEEHPEPEAKLLARTASQVSMRSLTESPLAHRRIKIIRRYLDEDID